MLVDAAFDGLRIFVPETIVLDDCQVAVVANFEAAIAGLARAGAQVVRRPLPQLAAAVELVTKHSHILGAEALHVHRTRLLGPDADRIDHRVVERLRRSERMTAVDLVKVMQTREHHIAESAAVIRDAIIAFPTTSPVAMPIAPLEVDDDLFARENMQTLRNAMLGNFLGGCGAP